MAKLFEVTIRGTYAGQMVINRINMVSTNDLAATASAFGLLHALGCDPADTEQPRLNSFFDFFTKAQTEAYQITVITARNPYSNLDFITVPVGGPNWAGQIVVASGDGSFSFVAQKLKTNRIRADIRAGTMALTPPSEEDMEGNHALTVLQRSRLAAVGGALNVWPSYTVGADVTSFEPAIVKKEKYVPDPDKPEKVAYRYKKDDEAGQLELTAHPVLWEAVATVTSQTSRRIGKGA